MAEDWRAIPDCDGKYEASSLGQIRNSASGQVLKYWLAGADYKHGGGYRYVGLGRKRRESVHRLVCSAFHGVAPEGKPHVAHYDGDRQNNRPGNLRWVSRSENLADSIRHGTVKLIQYRMDGYKPRRNPNPRRGNDCPYAKLNYDKARAIRRSYSEGIKCSDLAAAYGVGKTQIFRVIHGEAWAE